MNGRLTWLVVFAGGLVACGQPRYENPPALEVIYLPLEGAREVPAAGLQPRMYFSDELDETTVSEKTVFLKQSLWSCAEQCSCSTNWAAVLGTLLIKNNCVTFVPDSQVDLTKSCLVMAATTSVKGKNTAPLASLDLPEELSRAYGLEAVDVGAWQRFWTAQ